MSSYYVQKMSIQKLWGIRDINLTFEKDINIIIGPNASGKTTILNLLRHILCHDYLQLREIEFEKIEIILKAFNDDSIKTIIIQPIPSGYKYIISKQNYEIHVEPIILSRKSLAPSLLRDYMRIRNPELEQTLNDMVDFVWLPVGRRLPFSTEEDAPLRRSNNLESVDVRLRELLGDLKNYRLGLEAKLSQQYKEFEKNVLQVILYSKEFDRLGSFSLDDLSNEDEKQQLIRAFRAAGLLDENMRGRINEHFSAAKEAIEKLIARANNEIDAESAADVLFIIPLIRRTKSIIQYARKLEEDRNVLFSPISKFEEIVNKFLKPKKIKIEDTGDVMIYSPEQNNIQISMLSSGEKQILILLTQALVREDKHAIYVVDEPELSLHVIWQETLLKSLAQLTPQSQIIVATHSPDIIGQFNDKVIDLGSL